MTFTRDLGTFDSLQTVWSQYPSGGQTGDYLNVNGRIYWWDSTSENWVMWSQPKQSARGAEVFNGDVHIGNNLTVGGILNARVVYGRDAFCGLYATSTALNTYCPKPLIGQWALVIIENRQVGSLALGEVYICETDGTWTDAGYQSDVAGIIGQLVAEATARQTADTELQENIDAEAQTREEADATLQQHIDTEAQTREEADTALGERLDAEAQTREEADTALGKRIDAEIEERVKKDDVLQEAINEIKANIENGYVYAGIANLSTLPKTGKVFYIATTRGRYVNFGNVYAPEGINILKKIGNTWISEFVFNSDELRNEIHEFEENVRELLKDYKPIEIHGDVTNAPDEEDLTTTPDNLLKLKDNEYNPLMFSGLGRKILRKNIVAESDYENFDGFVEGVTTEGTLDGTPDYIYWDRINEFFVGKKDDVYYSAWTDDGDYVPTKNRLFYMFEDVPYLWNGTDLYVSDYGPDTPRNILTQEMLSEENTIYEIRYDFDLDGETVTIPENCILKFDGGSLKNGTVSALGTLNLSGVGNLMNLSLLGVEDGYINIDDSLTILGEFAINHFVIFTDIFKNFLPRAHRIYINNLMCLDITDVLNTIGNLLWESADMRFYRPAPLINIPKDEYVISATVTLPSGVSVEWNQSTILLGGNLEDFYCDDMSESENDYYMFRIGDMFYGNLIGDPNVRHGNYFRNVYATDVDQTLYDKVVFMYVKTHIHIDSITTKHYKKTVVYNLIRRNSKDKDAGYLDNKTLSNVLVLDRDHANDQNYDIEVYWGDGCLLEHIQDARCLVMLSDACHLDSCINVKLHTKESNVIVTNYYCSHANINIWNSNVVVERGHFILGSAGGTTTQDNYVPITIRTEVPTEAYESTPESPKYYYKKSRVCIKDCEFIGRALNGTHKFSLNEIEYDIDNDEQSELIIDNCYSRMSGWYEGMNTPLIFPFVKSGDYTKISVKQSANTYLNLSVNGISNNLINYFGADTSLGELYVFVASWLDKKRKIGTLTKISSADPEKPVYIDAGSARLLKIEIQTYESISNELTFYIGSPISGHIVWKEASLSVQEWCSNVFYYNGKTLDNHIAFKPCDFDGDIIDGEGNIKVDKVLNKGSYINREEDKIEAICSFVPVMGTWNDGDTVTVGANVYVYNTNGFLCVNGTYDMRPEAANFEGKQRVAGFLFYNRTYSRNERWGRIGTDTYAWLNEDGINLTNVTYSKGSTATRLAMTLNEDNAGFKYYDTSLSKYVFWNGTAWVDALGNAVDTVYIPAVSGGTTGNVPMIKSDGTLEDSGKAATNIPNE